LARALTIGAGFVLVSSISVAVAEASRAPGHSSTAPPTSTSASVATGAQVAGLVGDETCLTCHEGQKPIEKTLQSFAVNLSANPTFGQILNQARGEKVEVVLQQANATQPGTMTGSIMGVEQKQEAVDKALVNVEQLNMWCAAGLGMLDIVKSFWDGPDTLKPNAGQTRTRELGDGTWGKAAPPASYAELVSDAFYIAARNGHMEVAKFLLGKGADINCRGFFGAPGLHWAAINGHKAMVEFLLEHGADATLQDQQFNSTALGWAMEGKQHEIAELLKARGAGK